MIGLCLRLQMKAECIFTLIIAKEGEKEMKNNKQSLKKTNEELQEYLLFRRRGNVVEAKKGKGAKYTRAQKHKGKEN